MSWQMPEEDCFTGVACASDVASTEVTASKNIRYLNIIFSCDRGIDWHIKCIKPVAIYVCKYWLEASSLLVVF